MSYENGMPAGGNSRFRGYPARMSERQQLALLLQMTSQEIVPGTNRSESGNAQTSSSNSRSIQQQRGSKGRWTNKNGESPAQTNVNRKEDYRVRQMIVNGYEINTKEANADSNAGATSPEESAVASTPGSPHSPGEPSTTTVGSSEQQDQQEQQLYQHIQSQYQPQQQQDSRSIGSASAAAAHVAEDSGAPCEMRRTPPQNKVDRSSTGQSGSSPRVTLRLNQVRGTRDEKKSAATNSRQGNINSQMQQHQTEMNAKQNNAALSGTSSTANASSSGTAGAGSAAAGSSASTTEGGDVYEFKSSKEPTPVRGTSSSPNLDKDKDSNSGKATGCQSASSTGGNSSAATSNVEQQASNASSGTTSPAAASADDNACSAVSASPSNKRPYEGEAPEDQDDDNRRKKRKDNAESAKDAKPAAASRQSTGRASIGATDKCAKSNKQGSSAASSKNNQSTSNVNSDRKSPNASSMASSPKPSTASSSSGGSKTTTPAPPESDGEDDRSKSSDSGSAPKVPPLKIVIPQSTANEQEQGNRNGKNTSSRNHQLPYVVASSNSNDSTDKDQGQTASGTTSPTESNTNAVVKTDEKKDFTGALHGEERSTHHQRVLRSSHRTGNGNNGSAPSKDTSASAGNGNYSNSSPLPSTSATDRSNNSSPQQRHHSPTPETSGSDSNKSAPIENASNTGNASKSNTTTEKSEKTSENTGKNQKDGSTDNTDNSASSSSVAPSTSSTAAAPVELHPRKRKLKPSKEAQQAAASAAASEVADAANTGPEVHPHDQPITNCYQLFLNIRKQIDRRRKGLFPVQPKPPQGFKDYLMNRCTYVLAGNAKEPTINPPPSLQGSMKELYIEQEKERHRLRMQHVVEKEKLVLSVEQEILRVHGRAARALANQSLPFSVCTILKDEEVYNVITPEQEEKDRNARSRYNGRLFLSWLQDVDDKWEKIKESMLLRHHNEAESLHAVQKMHWEWKLKEVGLCEVKATPQIEDVHVPMVHVSDDFDLLPA